MEHKRNLLLDGMTAAREGRVEPVGVEMWGGVGQRSGAHEFCNRLQRHGDYLTQISTCILLTPVQHTTPRLQSHPLCSYHLLH